MTPHGLFGVRSVRRPALIILCAALMTPGCGQPTVTAPYPAIDGDLIRTHHARLHEAAAGGIEPGSPGEHAAAQYLMGVFRGLGLDVEAQPVRLTKVTPTTISLKVGARTLRPGDDYVAWTRRHETTTVLAEAPVLFMGYGISIPSQGWDDYKDVDVKGKVLLMLIGSPHSGKRDLLGALGANWYGQRRYKFEEAHRRGAAGVLLIRVDDQLGDVPELSWEHLKTASTEILGVGTPENATTHLAVEGWMTPAAAREVLTEAGLDFDEVKRQAAETNFKPVPVPLRAAVEIRSEVSSVTAENVVATLKGTIPGYVLYSAQWNDLPSGGFTGSDLADTDPGNQPPPGAPILVEVARALVKDRVPRRTLVFLMVTAGSEGLLGLDAYLRHPVYPLSTTRAAIHMMGYTEGTGESQISYIGGAFPGLKELVHDQAAEQFRVASGDHDRERLHFFRPGEALYMNHGIPSVFLTSRASAALTGQVTAAGAAARPDHSIAVLDAQLLFHVGLAVARSNNWPTPRPARPVVPGTRASPGTRPLGGMRR